MRKTRQKARQTTTQKQVVALLAGLFMFMAGAANAVIVTNRLDLGIELVEGGEDFYVHNLSDDGFVPGSATAASLLLQFSLEPRASTAYLERCETACDAALLPLPGAGIESQFVRPPPIVRVAGDDVDVLLLYQLDAKTLVILNADGFIDVNIFTNLSGNGGGVFESAALTVDARFNPPVTPPGTGTPPGSGTPPMAISEPTVLSLLGLGLLAGALRRRTA